MSLATDNKFWFKTPAEIVERRNKLGLTQTDFWAAVGISQSGGCRYELGRNIPRPVAVLLHIAYSTEGQALAMVAQIRERASRTDRR